MYKLCSGVVCYVGACVEFVNAKVSGRMRRPVDIQVPVNVSVGAVGDG